MTQKSTHEELEQRVTKLEKENIELKGSEEKYRLIIEQTVNPLVCFSLYGHIQMINTAAANNMGGTPDEFVGKTIHKILPDKAGLTMERIRRIRESGSGFKFEDFVDLPSGNYWYLTDILPIRDKHGEIIAIQVISSDITEKKLAEQALIKSERKYRVLFEDSAEGILVEDIKTKKFKYANPEICRILGYTEDELIKMGVSDIHPREALDHVISEFEVQAQGEKTLAPKIPCLTKNGNIIYVDIKSTKALIDDRECNIKFFTDITERKQAEEALSESEEKYRLLVDNFRDPIVLYDSNGINLVMNPAAAINMGGQDSKPEDFIGRSVYDFFPEQADFTMERNHQVIETGKRAEFEDFVVLPSGSFWFWSILQPVKDANGDTYAVQIISHDITDRKRAEEELRDREEKLRIIFENINEEVVYLDSHGICLDVNKKVEDIFGYTPEEVIGKYFTEIPFCSPDTFENLIGLFSKAASGDFSYLTEIEGLRKDGTKIDIEISTNTIKKDGEIKNIIAVIRDITERKQAEEEKARLETQLQRAQKMEAIGTLAGGVAHDLNNILTGIVSYPDLLLMQLPEGSPLKKPILTIQDSGKRAAAIVQDLLTLARRGVPVSEVVNLNTL